MTMADGKKDRNGSAGGAGVRSTGELPWVAGNVQPDEQDGSGTWSSDRIESPTGKEVQKKSRDELVAEKREERLKKALAAEREASERRTRAAAYIGFLACLPLTIVEYLTSGRLALGVWAVCFCMIGTMLFMRRSNRLERMTGLGFLTAAAVLLVLRIFLDMR